MKQEVSAICHDIMVIEKALYHLLKIPHPSAYNKAQIVELKHYLELYRIELRKLNEYKIY